jgi:hypothetical protein
MDFLSRIFGSLANAKFPGGVVGRNLLSGVGACFALAALGFAAREYPWVLVLLAVAIVVVYALASIQANKFANKHPQLATLEGAQIITHLKTVQAYESKNRPEIPASQEVKTIELGANGALLESSPLEAVKDDLEAE